MRTRKAVRVVALGALLALPSCDLINSERIDKLETKVSFLEDRLKIHEGHGADLAHISSMFLPMEDFYFPAGSSGLFLSVAKVEEATDSVRVSGKVINGLAVGVSEVEILFQDGKEKLGSIRVTQEIAPGRSHEFSVRLERSASQREIKTPSYQVHVEKMKIVSF